MKQTVSRVLFKAGKWIVRQKRFPFRYRLYNFAMLWSLKLDKKKLLWTVSKRDMITLNRILLALLGSEELVYLWWRSPNKAFNNESPYITYILNPDKVKQYIYGYAYR